MSNVISVLIFVQHCRGEGESTPLLRTRQPQSTLLYQLLEYKGRRRKRKVEVEEEEEEEAKKRSRVSRLFTSRVATNSIIRGWFPLPRAAPSLYNEFSQSLLFFLSGRIVYMGEGGLHDPPLTPNQQKINIIYLFLSNNSQCNLCTYYLL